ncbi:MAG: alpha/beta hydrolase [Rhodospirillaceae bacterium]|nr:alpha/beta hydrolase [Rhodospirillaceae bacterium]
MMPPALAIPRQGPRPLALHLALAQTAWASSLAVLPHLKSGLPGWNPTDPRLAQTAAALLEHDARGIEALEREIDRRHAQLLTGIARYRSHPYRRALPDPPVLWQEGSTRLLDYRPDGHPAALFVPSLVNRGYILDLSARHSLLRWLADQGLRPLLVDWGRPDEAARDFTLTDYVAGRLDRALDVALHFAEGALPVVGYCMGGLLAVALAQRRREAITGIALLATPWDFHAEAPDHARRGADVAAMLGPLLDSWGELPVDVLQTLFAGIDPLSTVAKFMAFADGPGERAEAFVALEDWLNDGVPLAGPVARECLAGWYGENTPARGRWRIAQRPVMPGAVRRPSLHMIPARDRIVPPASARALAAAMPGAEVVEPPLGHIGMMVGGGARRDVWQPLARWLSARAR